MASSSLGASQRPPNGQTPAPKSLEIWLIAFRQCPKRLWLEVHRPDLRVETSDMEARFQVGYKVGEIARRIYDPNGSGVMVDTQAEGFGPALARSAALLE